MNVFAEKYNFYVLYPEQTSSANANKCWLWCAYHHHLTPLHCSGDGLRGCVCAGEGRWEPTSQARNGDNKLIADMTAKVISSYNVSSSRVFVGGLSAGAAQSVLVAVGISSGDSWSLFVSWSCACVVVCDASCVVCVVCVVLCEKGLLI
jgi:poly(3-hydroxybutyrate) depolymerase